VAARSMSSASLALTGVTSTLIPLPELIESGSLR
jgi:hypothetical protein